MKKLYRKIIKKIVSLPGWIDVKKTFLFEIISIIRKNALYKDVHWTKEQKTEFDEYWKRVYGKKISNRWHKLYQSINGTFRADYFPEMLFSTKVEPKMNSYMHSKLFADKNLLGVLFAGKIQDVRPPYTYVYSCRGMMFDGEGNQISIKKAEEILWNKGEAVIKPTVDSSSGRGVIVVDFKDGYDRFEGISVKAIMEKYKTDFVVQERIVPHNDLKRLYPSAINTIRAITYRTENETKIAPLSLRMGNGGSKTDNIHAGGMVVGITGEGICRTKAYALGNCDNKTIYTEHPNTHIIFEGYKIPMIDKVIHTAKMLHNNLLNIDVVSWDLTINDKDEIIVIEANCWGQSAWFPQVVNEQSLFGEDTEYILKKICK